MLDERNATEVWREWLRPELRGGRPEDEGGGGVRQLMRRQAGQAEEETGWAG